MGILARLRLAKIQTMARPNSPDMLPKHTKEVRLGIKIFLNTFSWASLKEKQHVTAAFLDF